MGVHQFFLLEGNRMANLTRKRNQRKSKGTMKHSRGGLRLADIESRIGKSTKLRTTSGKMVTLTPTGNVVERPDAKTMILLKNWIRTRKPTLHSRHVDVEFKRTKGGDYDYVYYRLKNGVIQGLSL